MTWLYKPDSPTNDTYFTFLSEYENMWKGQLELEMVLFAIITVVGTVGNVLILLATWRHKRPLFTWQWLLAGQCLSDLLLTLFNPVVMVTRVTRDWVLGLELCKLTNYLQYATGATSILCMTCLAVDRYLLICRPPGAGNPLIRHVAKLMAATCIVPLAVFVPLAISSVVFQVRQDGHLYTFCYLQWPDGINRLVFALLSGVGLIVSPLVVIAVCYTRVFLTVRRVARRVMATACFQVKDSNSATPGSGGDKGSAGHLASNSAASTNLVIPDAASTNLVIPDAASTNLVIPDAASTNLVIPDAATTNLVIPDAASTNLVIPDATSTNLVIPDAATNANAHPVSPTPSRHAHPVSPTPSRHAHPVSHAHSLSRQRSVERRLLHLLMMSVTFYVVMWLPFVVLIVCIQLTKVSSSVFVWVYMLAVCNSCVNPVLFLCFNDRYRACVTDLLPGRLGAWLRPSDNQEDSQPGPSSVTEPDNTG